MGILVVGDIDRLKNFMGLLFFLMIQREFMQPTD